MTDKPAACHYCGKSHATNFICDEMALSTPIDHIPGVRKMVTAPSECDKHEFANHISGQLRWPVRCVVCGKIVAADSVKAVAPGELPPEPVVWVMKSGVEVVVLSEYNTLRQAAIALQDRVNQLERHEYICLRCGLRKDGEHEPADF